MFNRILLPSDLHNLDTPAVTAVLELAAGAKAEVMLLHVVEAIQGLDAEELKDFYGLLKKNAAEKLVQLAATFRERKIPCTTHIVFGSRARTIIEFSLQNEADVIVMQSHRVAPEVGAGGWSTISYHVAVFAQCPVLLVK